MGKGPSFTRQTYQEYTRAGDVAHGVATTSQQAWQWFKNMTQKVSGAGITEEIAEEEAKTQEQEVDAAIKAGLFKPMEETVIGKMFLFKYDAKWKHKLPYWDEFPLVFPIGTFSGGFTGINLHYLPTGFRVPILGDLSGLNNSDKYDDETRLNISYDILKEQSILFDRFYKGCVRKYLNVQVRSQFYYINPKDWGNVAVLPFERWNYRR